MTPTRAGRIVLAAAVALTGVAVALSFLAPLAMVPGLNLGGYLFAPAERAFVGHGRSPEWLFDALPYATILVYPILLGVAFWLLCRPLTRGQGAYPFRTLAFAAVVVGASALYFAGQWSYGVTYHGHGAVYTLLGMNIACLAVLTSVWFVGKRRNSWATSLALHCSLFLWIMVLAFPYLGETP